MHGTTTIKIRNECFPRHAACVNSAYESVIAACEEKRPQWILALTSENNIKIDLKWYVVSWIPMCDGPVVCCEQMMFRLHKSWGGWTFLSRK